MATMLCSYVIVLSRVAPHTIHGRPHQGSLAYLKTGYQLTSLGFGSRSSAALL